MMTKFLYVSAVEMLMALFFSRRIVGRKDPECLISDEVKRA